MHFILHRANYTYPQFRMWMTGFTGSSIQTSRTTPAMSMTRWAVTPKSRLTMVHRLITAWLAK